MNANDTQSPLTIFVGGTGYHPDDFGPLQEELGGDGLVFDNPLYRGVLPPGLSMRKMPLPDRQELIRKLESDQVERLVETILANPQRILRIIASSRGNWLTLLAAKSLSEMDTQLEEKMRLSGVLLGPVSADTTVLPVPNRKMLNPLHNLDPEYRAYRGGMDDATYVAMMERQQEAFIRSMKILDPREHPVALTTSQATIAAVRDTVSLLLIHGGADPFHYQENLDRMITGRRRTVQKTLPAAGHWPHIECPKEVAETIREWELGLGS